MCGFKLLLCGRAVDSRALNLFDPFEFIIKYLRNCLVQHIAKDKLCFFLMRGLSFSCFLKC